MAIKRIEETTGPRAAELAFVAGQGIRSTYTRVYQIKTDALVTDLRALINFAGISGFGDTIPKIGWKYPSDAGSVAMKLSPKEGAGRHQYFIMVHYDNPPPSGFSLNPPDQEWEFSTDTIEEEYVAEYDLGVHGSAGGQGPQAIAGPDGIVANYTPLLGTAASRTIENSAKDPFDPFLMESGYLRVYNLKKYVSTWSEAEALSHIGKINAAEVALLGEKFPAYSLLCTRWNTSGKKVFDGGQYYSLEAQIIYRPYFTVNTADIGGTTAGLKYVAGWLRAVVDQGFNQRNPAYEALKNSKGLPTTIPQLLNGAGVRQSDSTYVPVYRQFRTKGKAAMDGWGLPAGV